MENEETKISDLAPGEPTASAAGPVADGETEPVLSQEETATVTPSEGNDQPESSADVVEPGSGDADGDTSEVADADGSASDDSEELVDGEE